MMNVAILTGGESSEREVALESAASVQEVLQTHISVTVFDIPRELPRFLESRDSFDACVPVFHGKGGEDGSVQGFLSLLNIPFIFSDVTAHAVGLHKALTKDLARRYGIKTPDYHVIAKGGLHNLGCPLVVKPLDSGSSVGVKIVRRKEGIESAVEEALQDSAQVLLESFVSGKEFTVAVIDEEGRHVALPVVEIRPEHEFFDKESKYNAELCEEICPAEIDDGLASRLQAIAVRAHRMINAKHLTRSDFIVDRHGEIWFLEINTIPGLTKNSLTPKAVHASGRDLGKLLLGWIEDVVKEKRGD